MDSDRTNSPTTTALIQLVVAKIRHGYTVQTIRFAQRARVVALLQGEEIHGRAIQLRPAIAIHERSLFVRTPSSLTC